MYMSGFFETRHICIYIYIYALVEDKGGARKGGVINIRLFHIHQICLHGFTRSSTQLNEISDILYKHN